MSGHNSTAILLSGVERESKNAPAANPAAGPGG